MTRRALWGLLVAGVLGLAVLAGLAVHSAVTAQPSLDSRAHQLEQSLRCPSCGAESVAASNAPIARSMRSQVHRQLERGRSDEQIRSWFVRRYGDDVLLDPSGTSADLLLEVVPALVLASGVVGIVLVVRRRRSRKPPGDAPPTARPLSRPRVLVAGGTCLAVGVLVPLLVGFPDPAQDGGSGTASPAAAPSSPEAPSPSDAPSAADSPATRARLAFDLLRDGHPTAAEQALDRVRHPARHPLALLVLGLSQRARHDPAAEQTLRRFVQRYPHHRATDQVRRLLREDAR